MTSWTGIEDTMSTWKRFSFFHFSLAPSFMPKNLIAFYFSLNATIQARIVKKFRSAKPTENLLLN
jgi:hypothetical protein